MHDTYEYIIYGRITYAFPNGFCTPCTTFILRFRRFSRSNDFRCAISAALSSSSSSHSIRFARSRFVARRQSAKKRNGFKINIGHLDDPTNQPSNRTPSSGVRVRASLAAPPSLHTYQKRTRARRGSRRRQYSGGNVDT